MTCLRPPLRKLSEGLFFFVGFFFSMESADRRLVYQFQPLWFCASFYA